MDAADRAQVSQEQVPGQRRASGHSPAMGLQCAPPAGET
ncbi:hypothetical protein CBM2633_B11027 [Cupriavidus taiwanensis]|nr:hypothetical protein CBM2633_B11027 [Cupriavidus taiwanensis]